MGRSRLVWDNLITRYGDFALLRQTGLPDRWVTAVVGQFTAIERVGSVSNPTDRKALVSMISPDTQQPLTPDPSERDVFVALVLDEDGNPVLDGGGAPQVDQLMKIVAPPAPIGTNGTQLYWRLQVRGVP